MDTEILTKTTVKKEKNLLAQAQDKTSDAQFLPYNEDVILPPTSQNRPVAL